MKYTIKIYLYLIFLTIKSNRLPLSNTCAILLWFIFIFYRLKDCIVERFSGVIVNNIKMFSKDRESTASPRRGHPSIAVLTREDFCEGWDQSS